MFVWRSSWFYKGFGCKTMPFADSAAQRLDSLRNRSRRQTRYLFHDSWHWKVVRIKAQPVLHTDNELFGFCFATIKSTKLGRLNKHTINSCFIAPSHRYCKALEWTTIKWIRSSFVLWRIIEDKFRSSISFSAKPLFFFKTFFFKIKKRRIGFSFFGFLYALIKA